MLSIVTSRAVFCSAQQELPAAPSEPASHGDLGGSGTQQMSGAM